MEGLFLLLLFPLAWTFVAKRIWDTSITYQEMTMQFFVVAIILTSVWQLGKWGATQDTEMWNGSVTNKERIEGYYQTSSTSCNSKGENCTTTYTDHYTVDWNILTTVGKLNVKSLDSEWRSVYNTPDPKVYKNCKIGEPATVAHSYTNWVQAVPNSLFNDGDYIDQEYIDRLPAYPQVYGFYKYNRVIGVGAEVDPVIRKSINTNLNNALKTIGKQKQVNIIIVFTNIEDPMYRFAIETAWLGGEKNDVIVIVGTKGNDIIWTDVITWALNSGNELFHEKLKKALKTMGTVSEPEFSNIVTNMIVKHFDRPEMVDYEYLADEVTPAPWVIILAVLLSIFGSLGLTYFFHVKDVDLFKKKGYNSRRFK